MAFWQRKRGRSVYVYTYADGRQRALPRHKTRHLDGEPDHNVEAWVSQWAVQYEGAAVQSENLLGEGTELARMVGRYIAYLKAQGKAPNTIGWHETLLRQAVEFFLSGDTPLTDPQQWPARARDLYPWLVEQEELPSNIIRSNVAVRSFYKYLTEVERRIQSGLAIYLQAPPVPVQVEDLPPLKYTLTPDQALEMAASAPRDVQLIVLLGFFFSLRPFEIFGIRPSDFRAGKLVEELECAKKMREFNLYSRFSVHVLRQRTNDQGLRPPKAKSGGWVSCFDERAARTLVELLKGIPREDLIFPTRNRQLFDMWKAMGWPYTIKDMRRASLYWLGHYTPFQDAETPFMKHSRHRTAEMARRYLRRPGEAVDGLPQLDLDA